MPDGMASEASFLCTFCWTPQFQPAKPKVLGREARISCERCWKSVLDLSICWVCGEIVVRGEEVVSLGWCFWHRGCFGCLICGTGLELPMESTNRGEESLWLGRDGSDDGDGADSSGRYGFGNGRSRQQRGVELERVPLCFWCDSATDGLHSAQILEMGLQNVTKKDGGLSKSRLEILRKTKSKDIALLQQKSMALTKSQRKHENGEQELEAKANLIIDAGDLGIEEDGIADRASNCCNLPEPVSTTPVPMYVSVLDAVGQPPFRASKTKPLPRWMTLLPSNRQPTLEQEEITGPPPEAQIPVHGLPSTVTKKPLDTQVLLETGTTVQRLPSLAETNLARNTASDHAVGLKIEDAATVEPAILQGSEIGVSNNHTLSDRPLLRPQWQSAPFTFRRAVSRPSLRLSTSRSSLPGPAAATLMKVRQMSASGGFIPNLSSQIAIPLLSKDGDLEKRDISTLEKPIVETSKRRRTNRAMLSSEEKNESSKDARQDIHGAVDRRDGLRRELLSLLNGRREPYREQMT